MSLEAQSVVSSKLSPRGFLLMARCPLALSILTIAGCVMWLQKTTYYEAVDKPWIPASTEGMLTSCPSQRYPAKYLEENFSVAVVPSYDEGAGQIRVYVSVHHGDPLTFQTWSMRFTSLTEPNIQSSIPIKFHPNCPKDTVESCWPRNASSTNLADNFVGMVDVPPERVAGFILELQDAGTGASVDLKPQKFELRTRVLAKGTFGCY